MENGLKAIGCFAEVVKPAGPEEAMPQSFYASNRGDPAEATPCPSIVQGHARCERPGSPLIAHSRLGFSPKHHLAVGHTEPSYFRRTNEIGAQVWPSAFFRIWVDKNVLSPFPFSY